MVRVTGWRRGHLATVGRKCPSAQIKSLVRGISNATKFQNFSTNNYDSAELKANMSKSLKHLRFTLLIAALLPLSCATKLPPPKGVSSLNEKNSIVFGKMEVTVDDKLVDPKPSIFHPFMQCFISPYISNDKLNRHRFLSGKYCFAPPVSRNGYFSFVIPPGKYYFVEFDYVWLFDGKPSLGVRTYMLHNPFCITFDVPANHAAYIGTIRNDFDDEWVSPIFFEAQLTVGVTNQFQEAKEWFSKSYPGLETNAVEREIEIRPLLKTDASDPPNPSDTKPQNRAARYGGGCSPVSLTAAAQMPGTVLFASGAATVVRAACSGATEAVSLRPTLRSPPFGRFKKIESRKRSGTQLHGQGHGPGQLRLLFQLQNAEPAMM
jgi:hypothetical protein